MSEKPKIINVRGANGSGKSTLVKRVLDLYLSEAFYVTGRKRPLGYRCASFRPGVERLLIPGAYETPTGGCDTITDAATIYEMVAQAADLGQDVLFEGIVAQHNTTRLLEIMKSHDVTVIQLTTPLEDCIESVRARRIARGETTPFAGDNVKKEYKSVISSCDRIRSNGYTVLKLDREGAFLKVCEMLCVPLPEVAASEVVSCTDCGRPDGEGHTAECFYHGPY